MASGRREPPDDSHRHHASHFAAALAPLSSWRGMISAGEASTGSASLFLVMTYYALFDRCERQVFRIDTRIYLAELPRDRNDGECVAAVIGKNPGSATWTRLGDWCTLELEGDKMLPYIRGRFIEAYRRAQKPIPKNAYVRVWNLFYLCNENLAAACSSFADIESPLICDSETHRPPITWFVWGGSDDRLNGLKQRFQNRKFRNSFFFDKRKKRIIAGVPDSSDFAKHTQGLPKDPIERHLATLL